MRYLGTATRFEDLRGVVFAALFVLAAVPAVAEPVVLTPEVTESARAYGGVVGDLGRITYYDPNEAAPALDTNAKVEPERDPIRDTDRRVEIGGVLIALAVMGFIGYLVFRFGNFNPISVERREPEGTAARKSSAQDPADVFDDVPALAKIRAMRDRAEALNALLAGALRIAADAQGMRLHPSWTVRDALRRIPASWPFRPQLADLAAEAERVHFGGRPISEDAFSHHVQAMIPVYGGRAA